MSELTCLELSVVLWLVHVLVQAIVGTVALPFGYLFTSRDNPAAASGLLFGRATRALSSGAVVRAAGMGAGAGAGMAAGGCNGAGA